MARNVGEIEVTVSANTGRMTAKLRADAAKAGKQAASAIERELSDLEATIDFHTGEAKANAKLLRKEIEATLAGIDLELDLVDARAQLQEFEQEAERLRLVLDVNAELSEQDLADIQSDYQGWKERIEADEIKVELQLALDEALLDAEKFQVELERETIEMRLALNTALAENELTRLREEEEANALAIDARVDTANAQVELAKWRIEQGANAIDVDLDLKLAEATAAFDAWRSAMGQQGIDTDVDPDVVRATIAFQRWIEAMEREDIDVEVDVHEKGGGDLLSGRMALIAGAVLAFGESLATALQGSLAAATSVISSAIQGLGAAAGAAVPLVVALGAGLTAGIVGAQGFGDALKEVSKNVAAADRVGLPFNERLLSSSEALRNLAPSATAAALAFGNIRQELTDLRVVVQQDLFTGASDEIHDLANTVLPQLQEGLRITAQSVNDFGRSLSDIAQQTDFKALLQNLDPALDDAFDAAEAFAGSLGPFLTAAAPAAERLAEMIERGAEGLRDWISSSQGATDFADFLDDGLTSLESWVELLKSTGDLLGTIFDAGSESGNGFVVALNNIIERWDGFLESAEGQTALEDFFDSGRAVMEAFAPVLDGLKEAFHNLVDDDSISNFEALGQAIADALPAIADVMKLLSDLQIGVAIGELIEILGVFAQVLNTLPDGVLEVAGALLVAFKAASTLNPVFSLLSTGIQLLAVHLTAGVTAVEDLSLAMKALSSSNAILLAATVAITAAIVAWKLFSGSQEDASKKVDEFTHSLENNLDAIVNQGDAADRLTVGMDSLNQAVAEVSGEKLEDAFIAVNDAAGQTVITIDDTVDVLTSVRGSTEDSAAALADLAQKMGLPADAAQRLGEIVNSTDDNLEAAKQTATDVGSSLVQLADDTGIPVERLQTLFGVLEEIQDKGEDMDLTMITDQFDQINLTGTDAERAMLAMATATAEAAGHGDDAVEIWKLYSTAVFDAANAADDASSVNEGLSSSYILVHDAIQDAIAAHEAEQIALEGSRKKAFDAWQEEIKLGKETEQAASKILAAGQSTERMSKLIRDAADDIIDFGDSMRDSAEAADALNSALDILLNPFLSVQEAASNLEEGTDALNEALIGGKDAMKIREEQAKAMAEGDTEAAEALKFFERAAIDANTTLDLNTEAGRENAAIIRDQITNITDFAAAQITAGESGEAVAAAALTARDALVAQTAGFFTASEAAGTAEQQASAYIDTLGLTPELINTVFTQPGLVDALLNAEDLTLLYDAAGNPVLTEFEALGIEVTEEQARGLKLFIESMDDVTGTPTVSPAKIEPATTAVEAVQEPLDVLAEASADPEVTVTTAPDAKDIIEGLQTQVDDLDETHAIPTVTLPTAEGVSTKVEGLQGQFDTLDATSVSVNISTPGLQLAIDKVNELDRAIDTLTTSKTVTITQRTVTVGNMTGSIVTSPTTTTVGERGYAEAIVPLQLPLNRVDPSVRQFAEILRGDRGGPAPSAPSRVVNNYLNITPQSADPMAVGTQIINRAASLANR